MKKQDKRQRRKVIKIVAAGCGVAVEAFLTWLIISVATQNTELELVQQYDLPKFASLETLPEAGEGEYAVAIDDVVALKRGEVTTESGEATQRPTASTAKMILGLAVMQEKPFNLGEGGETITITQENYDRYVLIIMGLIRQCKWVRKLANMMR